MSPSVLVVIHGDPLKTHRPVEALRIALGLSTGDNPLTVVLLDRSPLLLTDDTGELMDAEILEKYLPSFKQLKVPFIVLVGAHADFTFAYGFDVRAAAAREIEKFFFYVDNFLAF